MKQWCVAVMMLMVVTPLLKAGTSEPSADRTLSPYFFVKSDDPDTDRLPLKQTNVHVTIAGVIADVTVNQVYTNDGKRPLEAVYTFPGSTRAAVYAMKMTIGERVLVAKIEKREEARKQYEQARQAGQTASLLEQQRPNVFTMNVANIMPGDEIHVTLQYTELLVPESGVYRLIYPTVVGPRYSNQPDVPNHPDRWIQNPYLHQGEAPPSTLDLSVHISTPIPVKDISSDTHKINVAFDGPTWATVRLDPSEAHGGNRDFILKYRLAGNQVESGLMLYQGKDENFFLLMVEPPKRVRVDQIPPRDYLFVVDVSGSMRGFPLEVSKALLKQLIGSLRSSDTFNVLLFAGGNRVLNPTSLPATAANIDRALDVIDNLTGGGGTELLPAMKRALAMPKPEGVSRSILVITDGYVSVERETFRTIREHLNDANLFAFGIGSSVNRYLIEGMARAGMGTPFVVTRAGEAKKTAERFRRYISSPVLTDIRLAIRKFDAYDVEPVSIPDVMAERPVVVFGKWRGRPVGTVTLTGVTGSGKYKASFQVTPRMIRKENAALRYLWARRRIAVLSDGAAYPEDEVKNTVTELGLRYNLLTRYTSFVAIDKRKRNKDGKVITVKQPLPLPKGVADTAVGGRHMSKMVGMAPPAPTSMVVGTGVVQQSVIARDAAALERPEMGSIPARPTEPEQLRTGQTRIRLTAVHNLPKAELAQKLRFFERDLARCLDQSGRPLFTVQVTIGADGKVRQLRWIGPQPGVKTRVCLARILKRIRLKGLRSGGDYTIEIQGAAPRLR